MIKKIAAIVRQDTAVGYYRLIQPIRFLKREGLVKEARSTDFSGENLYGEHKGKLKFHTEKFKEQIMKAMMTNCDIIWSNFTAFRPEMLRMMDYRKFSHGKLIIDIDDNLYAVHSDNPVAKVTSILTKEIDLSLKIADGITVSVPSLKKLYEPINKNIYIKPNGLDLSLWKPKYKRHTKIRIGWRGAQGHLADLNLVLEPIKAIIKDYDCEFITFGVKPNFVIEGHQHYDWVGFQKYPKKLADLNLDMMIVPLIDSSYNRCKSNLAILEASVLKIPVVASPTENQKGLNCLYASTNYEWYEQLEKLIKNKKLRLKIIKEQYQDLKRFNEKNLIKGLYNWMDKLPKRKDLEP